MQLNQLTSDERRKVLEAARSKNLKRTGTAPRAIPVTDRSGPLPLSFAQQRLWVIERMGDGGATYHMPLGLELRGVLDVQSLQRALDRILERHEALRTCFLLVDDVPMQQVQPADGLCFDLAHEDLRACADPREAARAATIAEAAAPFDLATGPLLRGRLLRLSDDVHTLLLTMHHIVSDGWSLGVLMRELGALYTAYAGGRLDALPDIALQYGDYSAWQRSAAGSQAMQRQREFWLSTLAGAPELLALPLDRPRPARQDHSGAVLPFALDAALSARLSALARRHDATLFMTLLAGWSALLGRLTGQDEVVIGSPMANRRNAEVEPLIGFFVNTVALRLPAGADLTTAALVARVKELTLAAQQHQDLPFDQVVEALQPQRSLAHSPLFQVMFALQNNAQGALALPGLSVAPHDAAPHVHAKFDLTLSMQERGDAIVGGFEYATTLFDQATIERIAACFVQVLAAMASDDERRLVDVDIVSADERRKVLEDWNDSARDLPREPLSVLFERTTAASPAAIAVTHGEHAITYAELDARANQVAHALVASGVLPREIVAVALSRGVDLIVAALGALKAGAVYMPLDPDQPASRLAQMMRDARPVRLVAQSAILAAEVPEVPCWLPDAAAQVFGSQPRAALADTRGITRDDAAYLIYTSGSTGRPKGVVVPHRAIVRVVRDNGFLDFEPGDRVAFAANPSFDAAMLEVWGALLNGGCAVVVDRERLLSPERFGELLRRERVSVMWLTVGLFNQYADALAAEFASLRCLITGGDALDPRIVRRFLQRGRPGRLLNGYGPTETAVFATTYEIADVPQDATSIPIGRPITNTQAHILDAQRRLVPVGVVGELHIGGDGVGLGYLNQPELSAERFLPDPFATDPQALMYKTGDLARWLPDGTIEFLGRNDHQVKLRGFRIELGEIEARLAQQAGVRESVVLVREDTPGDKRMVAYIAGESGESTSAQALRAALSAALPDYMVPAAFVMLDKFPLTPNGKIDRNALPAPRSDAFAATHYEAPQGDAEQALAQVWRELLGVERIGRQDQFFQLGGHSLMAIKVIERMKRAGWRLSVRDLFEVPSLAAVAAAMDRDIDDVAIPANGIVAGTGSITPEMVTLIELDAAQIARIVAQIPGGARNVQDIYPLAPLQEGIFFHHLASDEGDPYLLGAVLEFDTHERLQGYLRALQAAIDRHDILRTSVHWEGLDEPVQVVRRDAVLASALVELDADGGDAVAQLYERFDPRRHRIDVREAPLLRADYAHDASSGRWLLMQRMHHFVGDHSTLEVLETELQAHLSGDAAALPEPVPFRQQVAQARLGVSRKEHEAYFTELLAGVEETTAPFGLLEVQGDGNGVAEARVRLDGALAQHLRDQAVRLGVSAASLFHLAWSLVVARASGRDDVVFGTVLFGSMHGGAGANHGMGLFINTLPVRSRIDAGSVEEAIRQMHRQLARLMHHEHASLSLVQRCSAVQAPAPLFTALLNYRHGAAAAAAAAAPQQALEGIRTLRSEERTNYPLMLCVDDLGTGFQFSVQVQRRVDPKRVCALVQTALESLDQALRATGPTAVSELEVVGTLERQALARLHGEVRPVPDAMLHELFEQQADRSPQAVAVVHGARSVTYAELDARANRLARHLRGLGVTSQDRVAISMERGLDMAVAILATLKAGAAYVPLDPNYPQDRLRQILEDSAPAVVLADAPAARARALVAEVGLQSHCVELGLQDPAWSGESAERLSRAQCASTPRDLAYVIYTSGSTGRPKGVMIEHRQAVNFVQWGRETFSAGLLRDTLFSTSLNFDLAVYEFFVPLAIGATVHLVRNALALPELEPAVSLVNTVPSAIGALLDVDGVPAHVRAVNLAGEPLKQALVERLFARTQVEQVSNLYGPTETTTYSTWVTMKRGDGFAPHVGRPIANTQVHILDAQRRLVPVGVIGELYIAGDGVARGYLNQPELSAERFLADPFSADPQARMYKTGDVGRWLDDGSIEYLGRNDHQVKIRGFRIELGEIEARLAQQPGVREAVVMAREDAAGDKRLVAYVVGEADTPALRGALAAVLPDYMVPAAFVALDAFPLTPNGKIDRKQLPAPDALACAAAQYEPPQGDAEQALAQVWRELLGVERIGRQDQFFQLGGHSLMAIKVIERMKRAGWRLSVRDLFEVPSLAAVAAAMDRDIDDVAIPANGIVAGTGSITPEMVTLVDLDAAQIARIVAQIPGGAPNVQDIYPLAPLQEGIFFHHLASDEGDPYLLGTVLEFDTHERLQDYLRALQAAIDRHDILRTSVHWEGLDEPVQVVHREAAIASSVVELDADGGDAVAQLYERFDPRRHRIDVRQAPLVRADYAQDAASGRWLLMQRLHHLAGDHSTLELLEKELQQHLLGDAASLPEPVPFRQQVARARLGVGRKEHEAYFTELLSDVDETTAPFGLREAQGDGRGVTEARVRLDDALARRLREQAAKFGVSAASLFHLAWSLVLARASGRDDVVFGTVLFGSMHGGAGANHGMGLFINTLPVRSRIDAGSVEEALRQMHRQLARLMHHEHAPLTLAQRCSAVQAPAPLFTALLNYRYAPAAAAMGSDERRRAWQGIRGHRGEERTNYPLTLSVDDLGTGFQLTTQAVAGIDAEQVIALARTAIERIAEELEESPDASLAQIDVLSHEQAHRLVETWNDTARAVPEGTLGELFEAQVARAPHAIALVHGAQSLSYRELDVRANRLAHHLCGLGVANESRVALCAERGIDAIVAMLAIVKAGAAYVPLDPAYPPERLQFMLRDSGCAALLTQDALSGLFEEHAALPFVRIDTQSRDWDDAPSTRPDCGGSRQRLAYVIYTSGSTGIPKGVMVEHGSVADLVLATDYVQLEPSDVIAQVCSTSFDGATFEIWGALLNGARLVCIDRDALLTPMALATEIAQAQINTILLTTALFNQMAASACTVLGGLKYLLFGGEQCDAGWVEHVLAHGRPRHLLHVYGPTETTTFATWHEVTEVRPGCTVPIGKPLANMRAYVLDAARRPVPVGVAGEIFIGGAGVARGYLNREALSAERFVDSPFVAGERLYKTGDLGRWLADGTIEFIGRNDHQVKIRGLRIELGEIETRLAALDGVREAIVLARDDGTGGKRLVAYVVTDASPDLERTDATALRMALSATLPDYMLPSAFVTLDAMPLTPNGKIDRKSLPDPADGDFETSRYEAPQGSTEAALAEVWSALLRVERVGRHDHFFKLGGHSLLAVRAVTAIRDRLGVEVSVRDVFTQPVLKDLALHVSQADASQVAAIPRADRSAALPLSFAQQRLWFLSQMEGVSQAYHIPFGVELRGALDTAALQRALDAVVARHEALRTSFELVDGQPVQRIAQAAAFALRHEDVCASADPAEQVKVHASLEACEPFDLTHGPVIRGRLVRHADDAWALFVTMHHIVSDGWSMGILLREISAFYEAEARGATPALAPLPVQYADYAAWQRSEAFAPVLQEQGRYWQQALAGAPAVLALPTDRARPAEQDHHGASVEFEFDAALTQGLKQLGQHHDATPFMTLLAAWAVALSRLSGQDDVVIGSPVANRGQAQIEPLVGFFVNTLALRVQAAGTLTVDELMARVKDVALEAQQHQDMPFEQVVELVNPVRSLSHSPLFQVAFAWQNTGRNAFSLPGLQVLAPQGVAHTVSKFDLTLSLQERGDRIVGGMEYATALFERRTIERFAGCLRAVVQAMVADASQRLDAIDVVSAIERTQLLQTWNDTARAVPGGTLGELFEAQVARAPDAIALVHSAQSLSYRELDVRANRLAHHLRGLGVANESRVALCAERGIDAIVAMLAIVKAGAAYVPLDPAYPPERLQFMLRDSGCAALLTQDALAPLFDDEPAPPIVRLDAQSATWQHRPATSPACEGSRNLLAYVIYTSGSTGIPKGVMVEHGAVADLVLATDYVQLEPSDVIAQVCSTSFDGATFEIWGALLNGARLVCIDRDALLTPMALAAEIAQAQVNTIVLTTALFNQMAASACTVLGGLKHLLFGGEQCDPGWIAHVLEHGRPQHLLHLYGPTETTTFATWHEVTEVRPGCTVPIGKPLANTRAYVLDAARRPVPVGVAGEIFLGGTGVARGYLNRPELDAERFIANPFIEGERLYKTGDIGRWLADGTIEFIGRNDHQVKIRGLRIELGEIETRLAALDGVREAIVLAREDAPGDKRLVAYVAGDVDAATLRSALASELPDYMVPAAFVTLDELPLTPNGKVDRRALPAPGDGDFAATAYEAPQGDTEAALAEVWSALLRVERVGRNDHFFKLGGHSLLAVRAVTAIRDRLGVEVSVRDVFTQPVLKDLALHVSQADASQVAAIPHADRGAALPLSFAQQRLWFLSQMEGVSQAYHIPFGVELRGALDTASLQRALDAVVARHEALRTSFELVDGQPVQRIAQAAAFALRHEDVRASADPAEQVKVHASLEACEPFDLTHGPVIRGRLVRHADDAWALFVTMHHIVSDGWSMGILLREISAFYEAEARGATPALAPLPVQYADYAAWQRSEAFAPVLQEQGRYWQQALAGAPAVLALPTDRARPAEQDHHGASVEFEFDAALTQGLKQLGQHHDATPFMTLLAAWAVALSRLSGQDDVVIGSPVANRGQAQIEPLVGFFVNTLALRVQAAGTLTVDELMARVKDVALEAQQHQDMPFEQVVELVNPVRSLSHSPLFQVAFAWQNTGRNAFSLPGLQVLAPQGVAHTVSKFDLTLSLQERGDRIVGGMEYATALFERRTIERFAGCLRAVVQAMVADAAQRLDAIDVVSAIERTQLLQTWNDTARAVPEGTLGELFEAQVKRTPDAVAIVHGARSLSYAALDARSNQVAHALAASGVRPLDIVAVALPRGAELVVAMLGVLKCGATFLPLDPDQPASRLALMMGDARPVRLIAESARVAAAAPDVPCWVFDGHTDPFEARPRVALASPGTRAGDAACILYTSGSTGVPKGVVVPHRAVTRVVVNNGFLEFEAGDAVAFAANPAFDAAMLEVWGALLNGARSVVVERDQLLSADRFGELLRRERVSVMWLTVGLFNQHAEALAAEFASLRCLITGGDALDPRIVGRLLRQRGPVRLLNGYGPTETMIFATTHEIAAPADDVTSIPIGRPITGTQVHVLDAQRRLVPVGVVGELHIGGQGLALGYLNQPALTAERFVDNPFVAGERLYRTGDLVRWLPDGLLEFIGRNDHQVKIRGFRVELGEIEARLAQQPGVREAVVLARADGAGGKRLVAYVVTDSPQNVERTDAATLRTALSATLPDYMLPSAFVTLDALPLTPNGKIDRKSLPDPADGDFETSRYEAPQGDVEGALAAIWSELLGREGIGRNDHFFKLGGHSLLVMRVIDAVRRRLGTVLAVRDLFGHPVLRDLARVIRQEDAIEPAGIVIEREITLDPAIQGHAHGDGWTRDPSEILLTGATGFLGMYLLCELLARTTARIHCLVRCTDDVNGRERLRRCFGKVGLDPALIDARVVIVPGDLAQPRLGLSPDAFDALAATITAIHHNGAFVHSLHTYETLKAANVDGTRWLLRLAATGRAKHLHFVSSLNALPMVDAQTLAALPPLQRERAEWDSLPHGYAQTKWVAERLLRAAARRGLGCTIYRPAFISGHSVTGASNDIDLLSTLMDASFELGCVPRLQSRMNLVPVDDMAARIVELSQRFEAAGEEHDLAAQEPTDLGALARAMNALDPDGLPIIDATRWARMCMDNPATEHAAAALTTNAAKALPPGSPADRPGAPTLDAGYFARYARWRHERHASHSDLAQRAAAETATR